MPYITTTIIAEYTGQDEAEAAKTRAARRFPEMASRLVAEDTSDSWLQRHSWGVALQNGSNEECAQVWNFLWDVPCKEVA